MQFNRVLLRFQQSSSLQMRRLYSTSSEFKTLAGHATYQPSNPVKIEDKLIVFDSTKTTERRFVPYEIKEVSFKNLMGFCGFQVLGYVHPILLGGVTQVASAAFALNWAYMTYSYMAYTVRKIELHNDGRTVTLHPQVGAPFKVFIKDIEKLRHEKTLVETYEEAYLFPVKINGKQLYLHG